MAVEPTPTPSPTPSPAPTPAPTPAPIGSDDAATSAAVTPAPTPAPAPAADALTASDWPTDWREKLAGGDEKRLAELKRYASPQAVDDARRSAAERIRKGQIKMTLAEDATPEQIAEYRKANGVPETPDKYDTTLPEGLVIGEADKPLVEGYLAHAHAKHLPNDVVKENLAWYYQEQERQRQAQFDKDVETRAATVTTLREEFGPDYKRHVRAAEDYFAEAGEDFRDAVMAARMPDGTLLGANPRAVRFFIQRAQDHNPFATVVPTVEGGARATVEAELAGLLAESGDPDSAYWKGDQAKAKQARVLEINTMLERAQKRG